MSRRTVGAQVCRAESSDRESDCHDSFRGDDADHIGEGAKADRIRKAIAEVVQEGKVRTYDMMRIPGGAKSIGQGAASTVQMGDAILAKLK